MSISLTGTLLTGPFLRPDITLPKELPQSKKNAGIKITVSPNGCYRIDRDPIDRKKGREVVRVHFFNLCGQIPLVSTVTGSARGFLGLVHAVMHLAVSIFDSRRRHNHLEEAALGGYNVARGAVEAIPVIGNGIVFISDYVRRCSLVKEYDARVNAFS